MGGRRFAAPLAALALLPALLAGCGGGDDAETTNGAGDQGSQAGEAKREQGEVAEQASKKQEARRRKVEAEEAAAPPDPEGPAPTPSGSLPNEGTERVAPDVPTAKGGDNSIQEFGTESQASDRVEAAGILQTYLSARAAGEWATACSYLSASMKKGLEQFGGQAQGKDSEPLACGQIMQALTQGAPKKALRNAAEIRVLSMRTEDGQAFLIYKNGEGKPSAIPMADEDGDWKVAALDGSPLLISVDSL